MKKLQIMIDEDLDVALELMARRHHTSKAALIRRYVRAQIGEGSLPATDPLFAMAGADDFDSADIDEIVYR